MRHRPVGRHHDPRRSQLSGAHRVGRHAQAVAERRLDLEPVEGVRQVPEVEGRVVGRADQGVGVLAPDYAPFDLRYLPDALSRFEVEAPFRDRLGVAAYPVGAGQLTTARIVVTPFKAVAHDQRRVEAKGLRLSAWTAG